MPRPLPASASIVYSDLAQGGQGHIGDHDESYGSGGPSTVVYGHSGGVFGGAWDQDGSTNVGLQGRGAEAGNRISWPWDEGRKSTVPVYYHDVATAGTAPGDDGQDYPDVGTEARGEEGAEGERQHALEYVGCFRDHPGTLREYPGDAAYVFSESLTVNVRKSVPVVRSLSSCQKITQKVVV